MLFPAVAVYGAAPNRRETHLSDAIADLPNERLADLLQRSAAGDDAAFRRLYDLQASRLYGIALRITRQGTAAADAVHDTFVSAWQYADRFDPARGSAEAWLTSIVRYRALDLVRRAGREVARVALPEGEDHDPDPLARLMQSAAGAALRECLETLEADKRQLIVAAFMDGLSHTELAQHASLPLGTVKSSIRRGLALLRRCLEP